MKIVLNSVSERTVSNSSALRALRKDGYVPGVVYGGGENPVSVQVCAEELRRVMQTPHFSSSLFEFAGKKDKYVVKDVQYHPVTDSVLHVDFMRVVEGSVIYVTFPCETINESASPAVKRGGIVNHVMHSINVTCPLECVPESVQIDVSCFGFNHVVYAKDIQLPDGVNLGHVKKDATVLTIVPPKIMKEEEATAG